MNLRGWVRKHHQRFCCQVSEKRRRARQQSRRRFETLEPRLVLDAGPLITEFMAVNDATFADEDGDFSDWIEIHNPTGQAIELDGLTVARPSLEDVYLELVGEVDVGRGAS